MLCLWIYCYVPALFWLDALFLCIYFGLRYEFHWCVCALGC